MRWLALFILAALVVTAAIVWWWPRPALVPATLPPTPKVVYDCSFADQFGSPPAGSPPLQMHSGQTQGTFYAAQVTVPATTQITMTGTLVIIAAGDIQIDGDIDRTSQASSAATPHHLVIRSLGGTVFVSASGSLGWGRAADVAATRDDAPIAVSGGPGGNGAATLISGVNLEISGAVIGEGGGKGGEAAIPSQNPPTPGVGPQYPAAQALVAAGAGGFGGDVVLCAAEAMTFREDVNAHSAARYGSAGGGSGGEGGFARPHAYGPHTASGKGGPGGTAGDVRLIGTIAGNPARIVFHRYSNLFGGTGGKGGRVLARGGLQGTHDGGEARARGGDGGRGGTVVFSNVTSVNRPNYSNGSAGLGGEGGHAVALGGDAWQSVGGTASLDGGYAEAFGGTGGEPGVYPQIPYQNTTVPGPIVPAFSSVEHGHGGNAEALGGRRQGLGNAGGAFARGGEWFRYFPFRPATEDREPPRAVARPRRVRGLGAGQ